MHNKIPTKQQHKMSQKLCKWQDLTYTREPRLLSELLCSRWSSMERRTRVQSWALCPGLRWPQPTAGRSYHHHHHKDQSHTLRPSPSPGSRSSQPFLQIDWWSITSLQHLSVNHSDISQTVLLMSHQYNIVRWKIGLFYLTTTLEHLIFISSLIGHQAYGHCDIFLWRKSAVAT